MAASPMPGTPAGLGRRSAAWCLDWLLLSPLLYWAMRPSLDRALGQLVALRTQLEQWTFAQSWRAESPLGLWLELSRGALSDKALQARVGADAWQLSAWLTWALVLAALLASAYFIAFEAGPWQATPGKRWLGLRVVAMDGRPIGVGRAAGRFYAGGLGWLSLNIGHAIALFRRDGRALHDLVAGTLVVVRDDPAA